MTREQVDAGVATVLLARPEQESGPKELRVKIRVEYHLKLHALKLLRGKRMSEAVEEALQFYFEKVRLEREDAAMVLDQMSSVGPMPPVSEE